MPDRRVRSRAQPGAARSPARRWSSAAAGRRTRRAGRAPGRRSPCRRRGAAASGTSPARASCAVTCRVEGAGGRRRARPVDDVPAQPPGVPEQRDVRAAPRPGCRPPRAAAGRSSCRRSRTTPPGRCRWRRPTSASTRPGTRRPAARTARKPVHRPRSSTPSSAASMWSNSGASGRVSGRIAPVIRIVGCPAARCSRTRRTAAGASRASTWSVRNASTTSSRSLSRAPSYSR